MRTGFEADIENPALSLAVDLSYPKKPLLIAFGGIAGGMGVPPFEFFNLARTLKANKIFARDFSQAWYHAGLSGISSNIEETADFLRQKVADAGAEKIVMFGNSMGGYAAILFGILLGADVVHAFSPQTSIRNAELIRSKKQIRRMHGQFSAKYFDLLEVIELQSNRGEYHVYYDSMDELDRCHALHLRGVPGFVFHSFEGGGHTLVKELKDSGKLQHIVCSSLSELAVRHSGDPRGAVENY